MSTRPEDENPRRRMLVLFTSAVFALTGGLNLLLGEWLSAAFFLAAGFVFFKNREIERWPAAARALLIIVLVALAVAMFVRLISKFKALG